MKQKNLQQLITNNSLLTCFTAGFLTADFLAASETFLTVKGTPYLVAGLVIFWAGVSGMKPGAGRLAGHTRRNKKNRQYYRLTMSNTLNKQNIKITAQMTPDQGQSI